MSEKKQYQPITCQVIVCKSTFAMQKQLKNLTTTEQLNIISISGDESLPMLASFWIANKFSKRRGEIKKGLLDAEGKQDAKQERFES